MKNFFALILFIFLCVFCFSFKSTKANITVTVSAQVNPSQGNQNPNNPPSGGGGGGGGGSSNSTPLVATEVIFRGIAYPGSNVSLLKDGQLVSRVPAGPDAKFEISLSGMSSGQYTFSVWAQDSNGIKSTTQSFTVDVTQGVTTLVSGIFIPTTISIDKSEVKQGDVLTIIGQTAPKAEVNVFVHSANAIINNVVSNDLGSWVYKLDTLPLEYGNHNTQARTKTATDISTFSKLLSFKVGDTNIFAPAPSKVLIGDLNSDGRVDLIDFSILAYWYKKPIPKYIADNLGVSEIGNVNLRDFSIMAYYWTG